MYWELQAAMLPGNALLTIAECEDAEKLAEIVRVLTALGENGPAELHVVRRKRILPSRD